MTDQATGVWPLVLLTLVVTAAATTSGQLRATPITKCTYDAASCGCQTDQGLISLKDLTKAPLQVKDSTTNAFYFWHPCKDFLEGTITAAAIQNVIPSAYYDLGTHQSVMTSVSSKGNAQFTMYAGDGQRTSHVECECDSGSTIFSFVQEYPQSTYLFLVKSQHCCPGASGGGSSSGGGLSGGSILLIICLVLVIVYIVGGVGFLAGVRKAEGAERIPNLAFWSALPGLIKDGFKFTVPCGKPGSTYNQV